MINVVFVACHILLHQLFSIFSTHVTIYLFFQSVPSGEWFCPSCRPKEVKVQSPRKIRAMIEDSDDEAADEDDDVDEEQEEERFALSQKKRKTSPNNYFAVMMAKLRAPHVEIWEIWLSARSAINSTTHLAQFLLCVVFLVALGNVNIAEMLLPSPNVIAYLAREFFYLIIYCFVVLFIGRL